MRGRTTYATLLASTLAAAAAGQVGRQVRGVAALDVPELVGQGLDGLDVVDVVTDPHHAAGGVGVAVGAGAVAALEGVAVPAHLAGQVVPQVGRSLSP